MNICKLLSTKERITLLQYSLYKNGRLSVNKTAKELRLSKGLVSKVFHILVKEKILKKNNFVIQDSLNTKSVKIMLNLSSFNPEVFSKYGFVESAGIYGSFVKGLNTEDSDIDMWIRIKNTSENGMARLTNELKGKYENIKLIYLTNEKLGVLRKEDAVFYHSLVFGSIVVYGDGIE